MGDCRSVAQLGQLPRQIDFWELLWGYGPRLLPYASVGARLQILGKPLSFAARLTITDPLPCWWPILCVDRASASAVQSCGGEVNDGMDNGARMESQDSRGHTSGPEIAPTGRQSPVESILSVLAVFELSQCLLCRRAELSVLGFGSSPQRLYSPRITYLAQ